MKPRIIVCGLGRTGYKIFSVLRQQGADVVGMSDRPLNVRDGDQIVIGNLRSAATLQKAGIREAQTLVLASADDALNLAILTQARVMNPRLRIINRLFNETLGDRIDSMLTDHFSMSVSALVAPIFAFAALGNRAIGQLQLFHQTWPLYEEHITQHHPWRGMPLSQLWDNTARMLIYYLPATGEIDLVSAVVKGQCLATGDRLILGKKPTMRTARRSLLQKMLKAIANLRQYRRHVRPVVMVALALLVTIFVATLTYVCVNFNTSIIDALYFSVGMITGAGGQEEVAESASASIKVFTAVMMIVGAGVIGICYALINDFILGSRIRQFWDAARMPTGHHYIVCGLGGIGLQIVRQLQHQGYEVLVIERDANNRFLPIARSLGIPVLVEDARLASTLKETNLERAEALMVVTSEDTINVEIALTAKAIAPKLNLIVRSQDPQFAQSVQEVFEFENVLCPAELATPAFAAAALGGRILGNGMTNDLLWVALATLITPQHPFCDKQVQEAAMAADFVPLYLESHGKRYHSWELLKATLRSGDVLYLTLPAIGLEQLWRFPSSPITLG